MLVRVPLSAYFYVVQAVERALTLAFVKKNQFGSSPTIGIFLCSPGRWRRASSSFRKQTMLVRVPLSAYFYVAQADEGTLAVAFVKTMFVPVLLSAFLCSLGRWMRARSSLRKQTNFVRVPLSAYYYIAEADERALAVAFVNKLCLFESHYRHIFM